MLREVIIDGYNLLHAAGLARVSYGSGDLDRARRRLLMKVADLIDEPHRGLFTIVFDAKEPPVDLPDRGEFKSMHVRYAQDHAEADDLIEELIQIHSTPKRLLVVSGDRRLRQAARRRGAHSITGDEFLDALEIDIAEASGRGRPTRQDATESPEDMAEQFSQIDVDTLREEIESENRPAQATGPAALEVIDVSEFAGNATSEPPAAPQTGDESRIIASADEVEFWNSRIAELLNEERRGT